MRFLSVANNLIVACLISGFNALPQVPQTNDSTYSGNYKIQHCSHNHATRFQLLLSLVRKATQNAIIDTNLGTASAHGFTAFFKTNTSEDTVRNIFQKIVQGADIDVLPYDPHGVPDLRQPTFICVNEGHSIVQDIYDNVCTKNIPAAAVLNSNAIYICPNFWDQHIFPTIDVCPPLINNKLGLTSPNLVATQYGIVVHELAHLYGSGMWGQVREVYDAQGAVELDAAASLGNPNNYALYACGGLCCKTLLFEKEELMWVQLFRRGARIFRSLDSIP